MVGNVKYNPTLEWRKETRTPFYGSAPYWVCAIIATFVAVILSELPTDIWETKMFSAILLYLALAFSVWLWYFVIVWTTSRALESNSATQQNGRVIVRRKTYRNFYLWGVLLVYIVFPTVTLLFIEHRVYDPAMSRFTDVLANPFALVLSYICMFVLAPSAVWSYPQWRGRLELSSSGIKDVVGKYDAVDVSWAEIESIKISIEPFKILLALNLTKPHEIKRNFLFTPCSGLNEFDIKGMDVEPNAIIRVIRECIENSETRAILDTPRGVDVVTYGPRWRDIRMLKKAEPVPTVTG